MFVLKSKDAFSVDGYEVIEYECMGDTARIRLYEPESRELKDEVFHIGALLGYLLPEKLNTLKVKKGISLKGSNMDRKGVLTLSVYTTTLYSFLKLFFYQCNHVVWYPDKHDGVPTILLVWRLALAFLLLYVTYLFHCQP